MASTAANACTGAAKEPTEYDVRLGRGKGNTRHRGNMRYQGTLNLGSVALYEGRAQNVEKVKPLQQLQLNSDLDGIQLL